MAIRVLGSIAQSPIVIVKLRCPACKQRVTLEQIGSHNSNITNEGTVGVRRCPDPACFALVFFVWKNGQLFDSYPAETIDFDATDIPAAVQSALEEAIKCHSQSCFVASAIMVRKTLEELCRDRAAAGPNLKERIKSLGTKIVLSQELLDGLDDLRLLGNDAAHIESQEYGKVGKEEVEIGIEFAKGAEGRVPILGAAGKLRSLKKP